MAGTMLGKVWMFSFDTKQQEMLAAFSDEGIRGLFLDDEYSVATISEGCRSWRRFSPNQPTGNLNFRSLDSRNTQSVKHVLQRGPWACVLFPIASTLVNVVTHEHHHCPFRLFDFGSPAEVAPCDFDGESLVIVDRTQSSRSPAYHIIQLEHNEHKEVTDLPKAGYVTVLKLWGAESLVYAAGGSTLYVYDYIQKSTKHELHGHRAEVTAIDAQDKALFASLSVDAEVRMWNGHTGECVRTVFVPEASFFQGFPYFLCVRDRNVIISADQGVYLMEIADLEPASP